TSGGGRGAGRAGVARVRPTRLRDLTLLVAVAGGLGYLLVAWTYRSLPTLPRTAPVSLFLVALVELQTASITRRRLRGGPGTKPIDPLVVARLAVLAKASSLAGAAFVGLWAAAFGYAISHTAEFGTAADDALTAGLGAAAALLLVVAALLLDRVCRVPDS
nr:DUF3180 domain-containing protein [Micromonospora sp. DSM 115978]